jgi:cell cycle arrest protein BUB3
MTTQPPESKSLAVFSDGISAISYLPRQDASLISSTSWDGSIHIHDTVDQSHVLAHQMEAGPLLSLAVPHGMDAVACGGLDGAVRLLDIPSTSSRLIGRQGGASVDTKNACSCLESLGPQLLVSAGWSKKLFLWDVRQSTPISELDLPGKAFSMDMDRNNQRVVVATSGRRICFYDIRKGIAQMALERESSLKFQTRAVKFFPEGKGIVLGSIEGRVGVEFLAELGIPAPMKRYAFKCHRVNDTGKLHDLNS